MDVNTLSNLRIWFEVLQFISFLSAFIFGFVMFFNKKVALYFKIITCSLGCYALGKLYIIIYILCFNEMYAGFNVGYLGLFGCFFFMLSANYGQINGILDNKEKNLRNKRLISLIIPIILTTLLTLMIISCDMLYQRVILFLLIPAIIASYFSMKVIIFPDMGFEFIHHIRLCNVFILIFYIAIFSEMWADFKEFTMFMQSFEIFIAFLGWLIILSAYKGGKSWKI